MADKAFSIGTAVPDATESDTTSEAACAAVVPPPHDPSDDAATTNEPSKPALMLSIRWDSRVYPVSVYDGMTVADFKQAIQTETKVRPDKQKIVNLKWKGKPAPDDMMMTSLGLKPNMKIMMIGSVDEALAEAASVPDELPEVINDLDIAEENLACVHQRQDYKEKVEKKVREYEVKLLAEMRPGKKLLVLDIDYTLFDHRSVGQNGNELMRPYLHEFLASAYECRTVMSWSPEQSTGDATLESGRRKKKGRRNAKEGPEKATFNTVFDVAFFKTVTGILLVVQVLSCFLGMVLGASWRGSYTGGHVFFLIVIVLAFLSGLLLLVARAIRLDDLFLRNVDWNIVFGYYSAPAALLVLIASCVMVEAAKAVSALKAAGVFGLFAWNALFGMFLLHGRTLILHWRRDRLPTATASVVPGVQAPSPTSDVSSDEWSDDSEGGDVAEGAGSQSGVTLKQATLRPPSYPGDIAQNSQSSLYPMDIAGSNRASMHKSESPYRSTTESWNP